MGNKSKGNVRKMENQKEICCECGKSVKGGSGKFVNRVLNLDDLEEKKKMGFSYPEGNFICAECWDIHRQEIGEISIERGYWMTEEQVRELSKELTEDILERYDNSEYYDNEIVEGFAIDHNLKKAEEKEI